MYKRKRAAPVLVAKLKNWVLKEYIRDHDLTIGIIARQLGCSARTVKYWLKGRNVSRDYRFRLADLMGKRTKDIFFFFER
jgi:plasmid maintenance system antidote protein VapI